MPSHIARPGRPPARAPLRASPQCLSSLVQPAAETVVEDPANLAVHEVILCAALPSWSCLNEGICMTGSGALCLMPSFTLHPHCMSGPLLLMETSAPRTLLLEVPKLARGFVLLIS